jgi:hypothetical protein
VGVGVNRIGKVETISRADPKEALELMWRFMDLAKPVFDRCDDSNGIVSNVFRTACRQLGELALKAKADPLTLADHVFDALRVNTYGQFDDLISVAAQALEQTGLEHLKHRMVDLSNKPCLSG